MSMKLQTPIERRLGELREWKRRGIRWVYDGTGKARRIMDIRAKLASVESKTKKKSIP